MTVNHKTLIVCYSLTGVSSKIAQALQKKTQADLYEIKTKRTYDADMWKAWDEAQAETAAGKLPGLVGDLPDLSGYDTVLLGVRYGAGQSPTLCWHTSGRRISLEKLCRPFGHFMTTMRSTPMQLNWNARALW